ncbi:MAG TPA: hypothetical protein DCL44_00310 [Elusimicrobia bacterium]|nr:hypothetical protein [Elusimicrobiota bacterium]
MKLAILNLTGGGISGGYKNYLRNILPYLAADNRLESLFCVSPVSMGVESLVSASDKIRFASCAPFKPFRNGVDKETARLLSSYGPDAIFVPTARVARFRNVPVVTMIQNMAPLAAWEWYGLWQKFKLLVQKYETYKAVCQAEKVIAISGYVRRFISEKWGIADEKIDSIYFGTPLPAENPVRPPNLPEDWRDFIFTAGSIEPYRCLEDVIKCAEYCRKKLAVPVRIVIAGQAKQDMHKYERYIKNMALKAGVAPDLCWVGQIPEAEMTWCYRNCSAFIMTSRVEAGPTTVLEAMSCGAICVAADNAPLPEFFGNAAVYYRPGDIQMLVFRIREVLSWDAEKRKKVSAAAYARSCEFTWKKSAEKTIDLLERIL